MKKLRGAIIGCGTIAKISHMPSLNSIKNVEMVAAIDSSIKKAKALSRQFHIERYYLDYGEIIDRNDIDFVCITTPPQFHSDIAIDMIKSGKHVLIEKPMALTIEDAKGLIDISKKNDKIVGVVHNRRFYSKVREAHCAVKEGRLGDIYHANFVSHLAGPSIGYPGADWHFNVEKSGGGVLMDQGTHTFDLIRYLLGDISSIYAVDSTIFNDFKTDTSIQAIVEVESGTKCTVELSWTCDFTECPITLWGSSGVVFIEPMFGYYEEVHQPRNPVKRWLNLTRTLTRFTTAFATHDLENTHKLLISNFISSISKGEKPLVTAEDGMKSIQAVAAAYESIRTRSIINL